MKNPHPKYAGDEKVGARLERYDCPVPFYAVRTRFLGNIATTRLDASPIEAIKNLWGGELPEFEDMDSVNALFQDLMSLWNELTRHQSRSKPFRLMRGSAGLASDDLLRLCKTRTEELEGFVEGLFGDYDEIDLPECAVEGMEHLGEINAMLHGVIEMCTRETAPSATDEELAGTLRNVKELARIAEKEIHEVILSCKRVCAHPLSQTGSRRATLH